jgi:hypothetical protein
MQTVEDLVKRLGAFDDLAKRVGVLEELNKAYVQRIEKLESEPSTSSEPVSNSRTRWGGGLSTCLERGRFVPDGRYVEPTTSWPELDPRSRGRSPDTLATADRFQGGGGRGGGDHGGEGRVGGGLRGGGVAAAGSAGEPVRRRRMHVRQDRTGVCSNRSNACHMRRRMHAGQDRTGGCSNRPAHQTKGASSSSRHRAWLCQAGVSFACMCFVFFFSSAHWSFTHARVGL